MVWEFFLACNAPHSALYLLLAYTRKGEREKGLAKRVLAELPRDWTVNDELVNDRPAVRE